MAPIKILNGTQAVLLDYEKSIPSDHLSYSFTITRKDQFPVPEYEYSSPFVGVIIKFKRSDLGVLAGVFYMPTAIFSALFTFLIALCVTSAHHSSEHPSSTKKIKSIMFETDFSIWVQNRT